MLKHPADGQEVLLTKGLEKDTDGRLKSRVSNILSKLDEKINVINLPGYLDAHVLTNISLLMKCKKN